jgi:DNA invertase Pin-like site-specific DNA recombinase
VHNRLGLDGKRRPDRRCDNTDHDAEIRALRADGKPIRAIAAEVGCSVGTVHRVLHA